MIYWTDISNHILVHPCKKLLLNWFLPITCMNNDLPSISTKFNSIKCSTSQNTQKNIESATNSTITTTESLKSWKLSKSQAHTPTCKTSIGSKHMRTTEEHVSNDEKSPLMKRKLKAYLGICVLKTVRELMERWTEVERFLEQTCKRSRWHAVNINYEEHTAVEHSFHFLIVSAA